MGTVERLQVRGYSFDLHIMQDVTDCERLQIGVYLVDQNGHHVPGKAMYQSNIDADPLGSAIRSCGRKLAIDIADSLNNATEVVLKLK